MKVLSPYSLGTGVFWDIWFKFQLQKSCWIHWIHMLSQHTLVWVLIHSAGNRIPGREGPSADIMKTKNPCLFFLCRAQKQDWLSWALQEPSLQMIFVATPLSLLLWAWRILVRIHVKSWLAQKLEDRESPSIWRSLFRTGVILTQELGKVTWEQ